MKTSVDFIIGDDNPSALILPPGREKGLIPYSTFSGEEPNIFGADELPLIPMEEWPDRIADLERRKASLWHIWNDSPMGAVDQNGLPYCHAASAVTLLMLLREAQGLPYVKLSIGSVGGPVTGFRKRGAYIMDDLEQIVKAGAASVDFVPDLDWSGKGWKEGAKENAMLHRCSEFNKLKKRNVEQHGSALLQVLPVGVGLNYWSHAVTDGRLVDYRPNLAATNWRRYAVDFLNSWSTNYGDRGWGRRIDNKWPADEAYVGRQATASEN